MKKQQSPDLTTPGSTMNHKQPHDTAERDAEIVRLHLSGQNLSDKAIGKLLDPPLTGGGILKILRRHGHEPRPVGAHLVGKFKLSEEQRKQVVLEYQRIQSSHKVAEMFGISKGLVTDIVRKEGGQVR